MKYIFVTGGVVSSLGKGLAAASIGTLLERCGLKVTLQKFDPYLNVDPGTMSPFQHGEVYVLNDGAETDLDLGHYERFVHCSLSRLNNLTSGQVFESVLRKEILLRQKKAQDREIAKTREFIDRFRYKATKASLVQSRIKQLEKVELIEVEEDDAVMNFHFPAPPAGAHSVVRLEKVSKHYGLVSVFEDVDFEIVKGDRIAIVGVNGAGKSTFSRLISGGEAPSSSSSSFS